MPATGVRQPSPSGDREGAPTVLLVDDEVDIRYLARLQLQRFGGYDVVGEAQDGAEGVELAAALQPDVVLLDVMMPRMDGSTALPEILVVSPRSMVVMLSALDARRHEQPLLAGGAFAYLEKEAIQSGLDRVIDALYVRFRRALAGETVWAPDRPPPP